MAKDTGRQPARRPRFLGSVRRRRDETLHDESDEPFTPAMGPVGPSAAIVPPEMLRNEDRARQRVMQRSAELEQERWRGRVCTRGHYCDVHRGTAEDDALVRCPLCGADTRSEDTLDIAEREQAETMTPARMIERASDVLVEWASQHLNASTWSRRSEANRLAEARRRSRERVDLRR